MAPIYELYTNIPYDIIDPENEGNALDLIVETSKGYQNHSVNQYPSGNDFHTKIQVQTTNPDSIRKIHNSIDAEFGGLVAEKNVVLLVRELEQKVL